jgi:hypothetical protein
MSGLPQRQQLHRHLRGLLGLVGSIGVLFIPAALYAQDSSLQPFQASYVWYWHGAEVALSRVTLTHQSDDLWSYDSSTRPRGIGVLHPERPDLHSLMRITDGQVTPLQFKATGSGRQHDANVSFDWDHGRATGLYEGVELNLPVPAGVQDDLSVQIAMLAQLRAGKPLERVMEIDKSSVREYDYTRESDEALDTALGRIDTTVYALHHPGSPRTTRFWCAPSLGYIPLQVQQRRDSGDGPRGVEWTMKIRSLGHAP